jgi:hypothetical protein
MTLDPSGTRVQKDRAMMIITVNLNTSSDAVETMDLEVGEFTCTMLRTMGEDLPMECLEIIPPGARKMRGSSFFNKGSIPDGVFCSRGEARR